MNFFIKDEKEKNEKLYTLVTNVFRILKHSAYVLPVWLHDQWVDSMIIITTCFSPPRFLHYKLQKELIQLSGGAMYWVFRFSWVTLGYWTCWLQQSTYRWVWSSPADYSVSINYQAKLKEHICLKPHFQWWTAL